MVSTTITAPTIVAIEAKMLQSPSLPRKLISLSARDGGTGRECRRAGFHHLASEDPDVDRVLPA
jgi:hypothetical protein